MKFNYEKYFKDIKPKSKLDIYNRFIFAFTSVHTTWEYNIKGYNLLKDTYHMNIESLKILIKQAGIGLTNNRSKYISAFTESF